MRCQQWRVLITGASAGIGRATADQFAKEGAKLLLIARNGERLEALAKALESEYGTESHCVSLNLRDRLNVEAAFNALPEPWRNIDVLVNNAGLALGLDAVQTGNIDHWEQMIDTNVKGLLYVTRFILQQMITRNKGHIINIGSIAAWQVYPGGAVYCATKFAVRALTDAIKMDVHGTPIRTTCVNPGMVETEFSMVRFDGDIERAESVYHKAKPLSPDDIADAIIYAATRPAHVDVRDILICPTNQTAVHLYHREE